MALWGEGDPRWIVEERPDATNVNNWHWSEKNATPWSKERILQLFQNMRIEEGGCSVIVDAVDNCTGEATVSNRKGKLIFFYEWELVLKWSGRFKSSDSESPLYKGKVTIPNLSDDNDLNEIEITVTIDESNDESELLKQFMYNIGRTVIRTQLGLYIKELKGQYSKNLILPKKGEVCAKASTLTTLSQASGDSVYNSQMPNLLSGSGSRATNTTVGCKLDVRTLTMTEEFHCSANDLFNALTKADMLSAVTRVPAKVDASRGGKFNLYGGNIQGKFEELVPEKRIAQSWRLKDWPSGHYSNVVILLEEAENNTLMTLTQTGIPAAEYDAMKSNWHIYYWNSIKLSFGLGASLLDAL